MTTTMTRSANTARGLMTDNPVSINEHATLRETAAFLTRRSISAAPVINDAGRPVGVLSRTDIVRFSSGVADAPQTQGEFIEEAKKAERLDTPGLGRSSTSDDAVRSVGQPRHLAGGSLRADVGP